ncbi:MAG: DUF2238 domain-containing protein [Deltaproteobacteria bacterium]|nr:DUF2238 domain-containing protein [Deltaproteobacteria bacterium]
MTPLGNWAREAFHLQRNHYDRWGTSRWGSFPVLTIREVLLRRTPCSAAAGSTFLCSRWCSPSAPSGSSSSGGPPSSSRATPARPSRLAGDVWDAQ